MKSKYNINLRLLIIFAIIVVVNFISLKFFFRIDLTEDGRYSLSSATKEILRNLDETVTVTAYFTGDMPAYLLGTKQEFRDMLVEFSNVAGGNLVYEFVDPNSDQQIENRAHQNGIGPVMVQDREKDQLTQKKVYLGVVVQTGGEKAVIPVIQPGSAMEYDLASSIKKLSVIDKPKVGLLQGHGEPSPQAIFQALEQLEVLYTVVPFTLNDSVFLNPDFNTLAIIAPLDTLTPKELGILDDYLGNGGNLLIATDRVKGDLQQARGYAVGNGLESWLAQKGIVLEEAFVIDANCNMISVRQQMQGIQMTTQKPFPYLPKITKFADHPVTKGLETVFLPFASPITFTGDTTIRFTPLATTSERSGKEAVPINFNPDRRWQESDFSMPGQVVAAVFEGKLTGNTNSRLILIANGTFAVNGEGQRPQQIQSDNISLLVNSIDWLTDETGLIDLRTKAVTSRPIDQMNDSRKAMIRWLNFAIPLLITILFGIFWYQRKKIIRKKRMEVGHV